MRNNGILNIDVARADLPMQPEYWIEETYVSRYEKLLRVIEKKTSFLPYRNTKVIREISFEVPASTTLEQIPIFVSIKYILPVLAGQQFWWLA